MIDEGKLHREASRGSKAEGLINHELFKESFDALRAKYIEAWTITEPAETNAREKLWLAVQVLADVENHIKKVAQSGRLAKKQLDELGGLNRL